MDKDSAVKTAELLLQINAIKLRPENPFLWASGWKSPIYCDNRIILSYPSIRNYVREEMAKQLGNQYARPDMIAGVATGAIGIGILVAEAMGLPFVYVRPEPKGHGRQNQIEGLISPGQTVVVIEDLVSTGSSSLKAVQALKDAGLSVKGMMAVFSYGFEVAEKAFANAHLDVHYLSTYDHVLEQAAETHYINETDLNTLREWKKNPQSWNNA